MLTTIMTLWHAFPPIISNVFGTFPDIFRGVPTILGVAALWVFGTYFYHNAIRDKIFRYSNEFLDDVMLVLKHYTKPYGVTEKEIPILMKIPGGLGVERIMDAVRADMVNSAIHIIENETDKHIQYEKNDLNRLHHAIGRIGLFVHLKIEQIYSDAQELLDTRVQERKRAAK